MTHSSVPSTRPVGWGLGDVFLGLALAVVTPLLVGSVALTLTDQTGTDADELSLVFVLFAFQVPLWLSYGGVAWWAATTKGNGPVVDYGLRQTATDVVGGFALGIGLQLVVPLLYLPFVDREDLEGPARDLADRAVGPGGVLSFILMAAVMAPIVEELFFRGLFLRAAERRWGRWLALIGVSIVFGAIHLQPLQFPALALFGFVAGFLTQRTGRLGPAVWAHIGFNATTVFALLAL